MSGTDDWITDQDRRTLRICHLAQFGLTELGSVGLYLAWHLPLALLAIGLALGVPSYVAARALRGHAEHAKGVTMFAAICELPFFPIGTAIAALSFWLALAPRATVLEQRVDRTTADTFR